MKERPILMSAPMVRATLDDTKTQTRRVVKDRHIDAAPPACLFQWLRERCPYGQPGDRLWVRETWARDDEDGQLIYRADVGRGGDADDWQRGIDEGVSGYRWRPSIHMPRAASRILLEVTAVRVESLQDINEADALAEGIVQWHGGSEKTYSLGPGDTSGAFGRPGSWRHEDTAVLAYKRLWQHINGPGSWDANPWVWCITFRRVSA